ncbi:MAG: DUF1641 domain-containing protein [Terriglobia bacterium]
MAQPIPLELPPRDDREQLRSRLRDAPGENAEALHAGYAILRALYDRGVLDWLQAALGAGDKVIGLATDVAKKPENIRALRNAAILAKLLSAVEPEALALCSESLAEALTTAGSPRRDRRNAPGFWALWRSFRHSDFRRGLRVIARIIEALGRKDAEARR